MPRDNPRSFLREVKTKRDAAVDGLMRACKASEDPRIRSLIEVVNTLDSVIETYKESRHGDE